MSLNSHLAAAMKKMMKKYPTSSSLYMKSQKAKQEKDEKSKKEKDETAPRIQSGPKENRV